MKQLAKWLCYSFATFALVLGIMMLIAGKFALGSKALLVCGLIFAPVGYYFQLLASRKPASAPAETGD